MSSDTLFKIRKAMNNFTDVNIVSSVVFVKKLFFFLTFFSWVLSIQFEDNPSTICPNIIFFLQNDVMKNTRMYEKEEKKTCFSFAFSQEGPVLLHQADPRYSRP